jgi:exopolyphosphatase/guanosine-5'-triphosphate,3'-diphosphate pyrophosphatase
MAKKRKKKVEPRTVAVIDIGSSAIRMIIAELRGPGKWRLLEVAEQPITLGRDVFLTGRISRDSVVQATGILSSYCELMGGYAVETIRTVGTSALREARNRHMFVDRVEQRTGIVIDVVEAIYENYLTYTAVRYALKTAGRRMGWKNSLIMEVGGGSTEVLVLRRGRMAAAHTLLIGTIRIDQKLRGSVGSGSSSGAIETYLREMTRSMVDGLNNEQPLHSIRRFVAVGGDARVVASHIGEISGEGCRVVSVVDFKDFLQRVRLMSTDEIVDAFQMSYHDAESLFPALLLYLVFLEATSADSIVVPQVSIRDGLLQEMSRHQSRDIGDELHQQAVASACSVGNRFHYDSDHARYVADTALSLFDCMADVHGLSARNRLQLEVAALLHEVGRFINTNDHHLHSAYIIENADMFGLREEDVSIISRVVRLHYRSDDQPIDLDELSGTTQGLVILKLAALLRVTEVMDRGHMQRLGSIVFEFREEEIIVGCSEKLQDSSQLRFRIETHSEFFEEVFGLRLYLP